MLSLTRELVVDELAERLAARRRARTALGARQAAYQALAAAITGAPSSDVRVPRVGHQAAGYQRRVAAPRAA